MRADDRRLAEMVHRLHRAHGQLAGVIAVVDQGRECKDVVIQLAAVSKVLDRVGFKLFARGLRESAASHSSTACCRTDAEFEKLFLALA